MQGEAATGRTVVHRRRRLQPLELVLVLVRVAHVGADERARQQGVDAGHPAQPDPRAHHPEARVLAGEALGALLQRHVDQHVAAVAAEMDLVDPPDHHVLVLHRRLAGLQALGALEADGDLRPGLQPVVDHQRQADQRRQRRDQPDQRGVEAAPFHHRPRQLAAGAILFDVAVVSHRYPCHPRSGGGQNSSRPAWSAPRSGRRRSRRATVPPGSTR